MGMVMMMMVMVKVMVTVTRTALLPSLPISTISDMTRMTIGRYARRKAAS